MVASTITLGAVAYLLIVSCLWEGRGAVQAGRVLQTMKVPEVTEAFNVFLGRRWRDCYILILLFSLLSVNWALAILFGQTVSSSFPAIYRPDLACSNYVSGGTDCSDRYRQVSVLFLPICS
jgi:hypothetical protein